MNLVLLSPSDYIAEHQVRLTDHRLQHIINTHRAKQGDQVRVGMINGEMGNATITQLNHQCIELEVKLDQAPPPALPLVVVLAMPRPKMLRRILRMTAEFGIKQLHLINSYRVEKSYWQTPVLQPEQIHGYLLQGLEQAKDTVLPEVHIHRRFKPFVEDELGSIAKDSLKLVAHPGGETPCPHSLKEAVTLAIGPEGGFIPYEVELLKQVGFQHIHLGPRILRVENALPVLTAKLFD